MCFEYCATKFIICLKYLRTYRILSQDAIWSQGTKITLKPKYLCKIELDRELSKDRNRDY